MKPLIAALSGLVFGAASAMGWESNDRVDAWRFRVFLDGDEIGRHHFMLRDTLDGRELVSKADFKVRILIFDAYRYQHQATERWLGNCLESLTARTDDNGEIETVQASRTAEGLAVTASRGREVHTGCVRSFAYWNPSILAGGPLLNSQTGEYTPIRVTPIGEETIEVRGRAERTQRYRLSGPEVEIDLWYAGDRDWVALEAAAPGDRRVRYEIL